MLAKAKSFGDVPAKGGKLPTMEAGDTDRAVDWPEAGAEVRGWPASGLVTRSEEFFSGDAAGDAIMGTTVEACWKYGLGSLGCRV